MISNLDKTSQTVHSGKTKAKESKKEILKDVYLYVPKRISKIGRKIQ